MSYNIGWQQGHAVGLTARLQGSAVYAVARQDATTAATGSSADSFAMGFSHGVTAGAIEAEQQAEFAAREHANLIRESRQIEAQRLAAVQDAICTWGSTSAVTAAARQAYASAKLVHSLAKRNAAPSALAEAVKRRAAAIDDADKMAISGPPKSQRPLPPCALDSSEEAALPGQDQAAARHFQSIDPAFPIQGGKTIVRIL